MNVIVIYHVELNKSIKTQIQGRRNRSGLSGNGRTTLQPYNNRVV